MPPKIETSQGNSIWVKFNPRCVIEQQKRGNSRQAFKKDAWAWFEGLETHKLEILNIGQFQIKSQWFLRHRLKLLEVSLILPEKTLAIEFWFGS